mmetsp:Transcript_40241/g.88035  ORF Transcript_40241/g.88035 Transcript_40241/m.88035 type:complete len:624 (+) Transcript_40241:107-1978(+)
MGNSCGAAPDEAKGIEVCRPDEDKKANDPDSVVTEPISVLGVTLEEKQAPEAPEALVAESEHGPLPTPTSVSVATERLRWEEQQAAKKAAELQSCLEETRRLMCEDHLTFGTHAAANRYGNEAEFPAFISGTHVPVLALINPLSGAMAGTDIMAIARKSPYYKSRFFNIIDVVKGQRRGGLLDVFRIELTAAKDDAKAMGKRPRLISGGGDGTASFAIFLLLLALKADDTRADEGLKDTGNGFIWTDEELAESFPALAQMPLGSANDCANILGWGQRYPGDRRVPCCQGRLESLHALQFWIARVIDPDSAVVSFDVWGIVPPAGQETCNFKIAELTGPRGRSPNKREEGKRQVSLRTASKPVPFFVCLYFSAGFGAYMTARFQLNRRKTPFKNRMEYIRQAVGIILESVPPQTQKRSDGLSIECSGEKYFPPRSTVRGTKYRELGFYNINWQAHALHGADRAPAKERILGGSREPVKFNDGLMDLFRWNFLSIVKNPGLRVQTDKRKDMLLNYGAGHGKGIFFQWDGEARFAFSPTGEDFQIFIRKVLNIPVLIGPFVDTRLTGDLGFGKPVRFEICGETHAEKEMVRRRILKLVRGELDAEVNATAEEIQGAKLKHSSAKFD